MSLQAVYSQPQSSSYLARMLKLSKAFLPEHTKYELTRNIPPQENAPNSAQGYFEQGVHYTLQHNWQSAVEAYNNALNLRPNFYEANFNLGSAYGNLGDHRNAIKHFKKAIKLHSDDADAYYYLALGNLLLDDLAEAEKALRNANRFFHNLTIAPAKFAWLYLVVGMGYLSLGWNQENERNSEDPNIWFKAERLLLRAIELQDNYPDAFWNLGILYSKLGHKNIEKQDYYFDKAIKAYEKAKPLEPDMSAWAFNDLGTIYSELGNLQRAEQLFQKAAETDPQNFIALRNLGILHLASGQYLQAAEAFEGSKQIEPDDPKTLNSLGTAYLSLNRFKEAKETINEALRLDPKSINAYINLGLLHYMNSQLEAAKEAFQKALGIDPSNEVATHNLQLVTGDLLKQKLFEQGLLSEIRKPVTDLTPYQSRRPIVVQGRPVSETLLEDRQ